MCKYEFVALAGILLYSATMNQDSREQKEYFCGRLIGTRENWPNEMNENEKKIMEEHFVYLQKLIKENKVILAGPVFSDPVYGLIILQVSSENEAKEILDRDPSVVAGLHTYDLSPMKLSLLMENCPE